MSAMSGRRAIVVAIAGGGSLLWWLLRRRNRLIAVPAGQPTEVVGGEWLSFKSMYQKELTQSYDAVIAKRQELTIFVQQTKRNGRKLVVVTSGGTAVPLEKNMVRFLDNFSSGGRGSACVTAFRDLGYAVIYIHRNSSLKPSPEVLKDNESVLSLSFFSLYEYLLLLELSCTAIAPLGSRAMVFLAAAVADFYMDACDKPDVLAASPSGLLGLAPNERYQVIVGMPKNKIQSRDVAGLTLFLQNTPKMLKWIKGTEDLAGKGVEYSWAPDCFMVTFKLETDVDILMAKAAKSLRMYHQDVVVANALSDYKTKCTLVFPSLPRAWETISVSGNKAEHIRESLIENSDPAELNRELAKKVASLHDKFIA